MGGDGERESTVHGVREAYKVNQEEKRCKQKEVGKFKGCVNIYFLKVLSQSREGCVVFSWKRRRWLRRKRRRAGGVRPRVSQ